MDTFIKRCIRKARTNTGLILWLSIATVATTTLCLLFVQSCMTRKLTRRVKMALATCSRKPGACVLIVMVVMMYLSITAVTDNAEFPRLVGEELNVSVICRGSAPEPAPTMPPLPQVPLQLDALLASPIINPHPYGYHHNQPHACRRRNVQVLFVVPSAPDNFARRRAFRGSSVYHDQFTIDGAKVGTMVLFFIGVPKFVGAATVQAQTLINQEAELYNDIVQSDFKDSYRNIHLKAQAMLKWASVYCLNASYVIRVDDDITIDAPVILNTVYNIGRKHDNFIVGKVKVNETVYRIEKYAVTYQDYPDPTWPPFALGGLLGYPLKTVRLLYEATLRVKVIWLDDVWVTRMCGVKVNATLIHHDDFMFVHS